MYRNEAQNEFNEYISGRNVAVLGVGISNTPLIRYLCRLGVKVTAFDRSRPEMLKDGMEALSGCKLEYCLGEGYLDGLRGFDVIFKTPSVRPDIPQLLKAGAEGAVVTSEMELFFRICPCRIFAVTGSDGKTTTTTIIHRILSEEGYKCWLGGNIGTPLVDRVEEMEPDDLVVLELSSFQLMTMNDSPDVAVVTNLSPNHLDMHKSMDEYADAKKNIYRHTIRRLRPSESYPRTVLNYDDELSHPLAAEVKGEMVFFSRLCILEEGAVLDGDRLVYRSGGRESVMAYASEVVLPGVHNIENYLAAIAAVAPYVKPESVRKVASTMVPVEHRIEFVRELDGVKYYNDSKSSSPRSTIVGLNSFDGKVILIAGGKDKNIPYGILGPVIAEKVKCLILTGPTGPVIKKALQDEIEKTGKGKDIPVFMCSGYEEAVSKARENARCGDIVLLSPASTSFDMFRNFEERGMKFKEIVNSMT